MRYDPRGAYAVPLRGTLHYYSATSSTTSTQATALLFCQGRGWGKIPVPPALLTQRFTVRVMLSEPGKQLFERVSVFAGDFTIEAAEEVSAVASGGVLVLLGNLVEQSLIAFRSGRPTLPSLT